MAETPRIIIRKSQKKAVAVTLVGFLLGMGGGALLYATDQTVMGWCFVIAAGFTLVYGIGTWFDRKPYIVLTPHDLTELAVIRRPIAWDELLHADDFYYRGKYFVRLLLARDSRLDIPSTWFWRFDRIYRQEGVKAVYLQTSGLEVNSMQLAGLIRQMIRSDEAERTALLTSLAIRRGRRR